MTDQDRTLVRLVFALAELAVAIEDAFGSAVDMTDLGACRTVRALQELVAARSA